MRSCPRKLLDFGVAKLIDPLVDPRVTIGTPWTPDYTSPEQVRGRAVTTRTDVYSLGLILYELLTGVRAQNADPSTPLEMDRSICEAEPMRPSAQLGARDRHAGRRLRGDLDTIVMTAIRKEPDRRYGSADPPFGMFGIAQGQTARLNLVNVAAPGGVAVPPDPCRAQLQFLDADGNVIAHRRIEVKAGHATFLDYVANLVPTNTVGDAVAPLRAQLRPVVNFTNETPPDPCRVSVEVFDNATGRTEIIVVPPPCRGAACRVND